MNADVWVAGALHLLAMAFFLGGQLLPAAAVVPVERRALTATACEPSPAV